MGSPSIVVGKRSSPDIHTPGRTVPARPAMPTKIAGTVQERLRGVGPHLRGVAEADVETHTLGALERGRRRLRYCGFIGHHAEAAANQERVHRGLDDVSDLFTRDLVDAMDEGDMPDQQAIGLVAGEVERHAAWLAQVDPDSRDRGCFTIVVAHDLPRVDAAETRKMYADLQPS